MAAEVTGVAADIHLDHDQDLHHEEKIVTTEKTAHHTGQDAAQDHVRLPKEKSEDATTLHLQPDVGAAQVHHPESDVVAVHLTRLTARRNLRKDAVVLREIATRRLRLHRVKSETLHRLTEQNRETGSSTMFSLPIGRHDERFRPRIEEEKLSIIQKLLAEHISYHTCSVQCCRF
jgi:hypothetical protein